MAFIALRKLSFQARMRSNPLGLHIWFLVRPFVYFHALCANSEGFGETSLTWAYAVRLCDKYHNLMSWLIYLGYTRFFVSECSSEVTEHDNGESWTSAMDKCMRCQCKV